MGYVLLGRKAAAEICIKYVPFLRFASNSKEEVTMSK